MIKYLGILFIISSKFSMAGEIYTNFSFQIKADEKYVFYSHGLIVEGSNDSPVHPKFGTYEFNSIKNALIENSNFNLIADHRPLNTDISTYTKLLVSWVNKLISAGVAPSNITLIGFSRGGELTAYASSELRELNINTILLATCWPGSVQDKSHVRFSGNFLSIYETTDQALSCKNIADRSEELNGFSEIAISTGKEHGAFFRPMEIWVNPVKQWINSKTAGKETNNDNAVQKY